MISRWNAATWPTLRRLLLWTEPEKLTFVVFKEREQQSMEFFPSPCGIKIKVSNFFMFTQLQAKLKRNELVTQTRNEKTGSPNFSSRFRRRSRPSCVRSLMTTLYRPVARILWLCVWGGGGGGGGGACVPQEPGPNMLMLEWYAM